MSWLQPGIERTLDFMYIALTISDDELLAGVRAGGYAGRVVIGKVLRNE